MRERSFRFLRDLVEIHYGIGFNCSKGSRASKAELLATSWQRYSEDPKKFDEFKEALDIWYELKEVIRDMETSNPEYLYLSFVVERDQKRG